MPLLLSHHARLGVGSTQYACDTRHSKGDAKGPLLGIPRGKAAMSWFLSSSHASPLCSQRLAAVPSHHDPAAADNGSSGAAVSAATAAGANAAAAPASQEAAPDGDWEAVRLMTAARILASSSSDDATSLTGDAAASLDSDSLLDLPDLSLSASPAASPAATSAPLLDTPSVVPSLGAGAGADAADPFSLAALARLDEIRTLDADSLALAVGILRQRQPLQGGDGDGEGGDEDGVQLSERLRDFLMVLRRRPAPGPAAPADPAATAGGVEDVFAMGAGEDEWADVRSALMSIGINASLDEEDDEDVWALEAGRVKTRRTRLLRSLPKLDSSTAQQLTAFLAEVQQHSSNPEAPAASELGTTSSIAHDAGAAVAGVSEEEEQWWQQASLAYSLLRQQAGKVQEQGAQQQLEQQQQ